MWGYFVPVLAPMVVYSWLALRWAIEQFQREEVLFREAERLDLGLWLRRLLREKEGLPSAGQACFCFALIFGLHWLSLGAGGRVSVLSFSAVRYLAFVAAPPLFMVLLLTTRPRQGLALRLPPWWAWPAAIALAVLLLPPFVSLTLFLLEQFPHIKQTLLESHSLGSSANETPAPSLSLLVLGVLPAVCEELAFRGFLLSGLARRFRPWTAILLSGFLYALYQMNVFQAVPHFLAGVVLALLVIRTGRVLPAIAFHLVWNVLLIVPGLQPKLLEHLNDALSRRPLLSFGVVLACLALAAPLLATLLRRCPSVT